MVYKGGKANRSPSCVFVGNLPERVDERDIHDLFDKFGEIKDVDIKHGKTSNYTSYAFIEFASVRSAEDAVDSRDGYEFDRYRLRVEFAGEKRPRRYSSYDRVRERDRGHRYPPPTRTEYRLVISNLPHGCKWQHLKDHMRKAGPVGYVNIEHGRGYVDFIHRSDMKYAVRKLDGSELTTPDDSCRIRVRRDDRRSRSRDSYRKRSHSRRSFSDERSLSRDRRSRSEDRSVSRERSVSRDRRSRSVDRSVSKEGSVFRDKRSRSDERSLSRDRSLDKRSASLDKRYRSQSQDRKSNRSLSRTYSERSKSNTSLGSQNELKLNGQLDAEKPRYDRDAETETAAETFRDSPLQV